jgi:hypothetical protein
LHLQRGFATLAPGDLWGRSGNEAARFLAGDYMRTELTAEEKLWCLEQAIAIVKEVGHGGASNIHDAAGALQSVYQAIYTVRQSIKEDA